MRRGEHGAERAPEAGSGDAKVGPQREVGEESGLAAPDDQRGERLLVRQSPSWPGPPARSRGGTGRSARRPARMSIADAVGDSSSISVTASQIVAMTSGRWISLDRVRATSSSCASMRSRVASSSLAMRSSSLCRSSSSVCDCSSSFWRAISSSRAASSALLASRPAACVLDPAADLDEGGAVGAQR